MNYFKGMDIDAGSKGLKSAVTNGPAWGCLP